MKEEPAKPKASDHIGLIVLFQIAFFVALFFGGRLLGANIIWVIIGLALLSGLAMFVCLVTVALDGFKQERGFWRKALLILGAGLMAIVFMYFYSRFS